MSNLLKNLLIALVVSVILFAGYQFYLKDYLAQVESTTEVGTMRSVEDESRAILDRLSILNTIRIDDALLSDARFASLVDFRQELGTEPSGRPNPFSPVNSR